MLDNKLTTRQELTFTAKTAKGILGCIRTSITSRCIWSAGSRSRLPSTKETWTYWSTSSKGPRRSGDWSICHDKRLRELGVFGLEMRRLGRDLTDFCKYLMGENGARLFALVPSYRTRANGHKQTHDIASEHSRKEKQLTGGKYQLLHFISITSHHKKGMIRRVALTWLEALILKMSLEASEKIIRSPYRRRMSSIYSLECPLGIAGHSHYSDRKYLITDIRLKYHSEQRRIFALSL
ncbi:hypothetical protein QYF61_014600, partial [Mycteria americana]